jgi:glycosyltransferase involved in cell wall biosynthesis
MGTNRLNLVYVGLSGFPHGQAAISRQKLLCKGLILAGAKVLVLCAKAAFRTPQVISRAGEFEGVPYEYAMNPVRSENFVIRNIKRLLSPIFEFRLIIRIHRKERITHILVTNNNEILNSIWYALIARLIRAKVVYSLVELYEAKNAKTCFKKWNHALFNRFGLRLYHAYLPISSYLSNRFSMIPRKSLYLPIMVNYELISTTPIKSSDTKSTLFLFCGSAGYPDTIQFCISAFEQLNTPNAKLILVAGGLPNEIENVRRKIETSHKSSDIIHRMNLSDADLYSLYRDANALLIPLFNTVQDQARFPHKLGEYLASGTPVITNQVGEITAYLKQKESGLFAETNSVENFADMMRFVLEHDEEARSIGRMGQSICKTHFDFTELGNRLNGFLKEL